MDRQTLRIDLVYTDAQEREFHVGRTLSDITTEQIDEWYDQDEIGGEFVEILHAIEDADRLAAEALGIGPDPEVAVLKGSDYSEIADALRLLADIDEGENTDTDRLLALAKAISPTVRKDTP